jgi:hypothetical protein
LDGYKRLIMFAPQDGDNLYEDRDGEARTSKLNIADPDLVKYPNFKNAVPYEVVAESGDVLFIPAYWFHQVESSCRHIAINFWFDTHDGRHLISEIRDTLPEKGLYPPSKEMVERLFKRESQCPLARYVSLLILTLYRKWDKELEKKSEHHKKKARGKRGLKHRSKK